MTATSSTLLADVSASSLRVDSSGLDASNTPCVRLIVRGYALGQTIGYGSFGKVKLAKKKISTPENSSWPSTIAVKIVAKHQAQSSISLPLVMSTQTIPTLSQVQTELSSQQLSPRQHHTSMLMKELRIHSALRHGGIVRLFAVIEDGKEDETVNNAPTHSSKYEEKGFVYMLMEYASDGELFDKIVPDKGLCEQAAHFYFKQLITAVNYLHSMGVCHRDLKPENMLLDMHGNLKITDFGFATVFAARVRKSTQSTLGGTINRQKRLVSQACGSPPYVAPEVVLGPYDGESADLWSCGIILIVLLLGVTPWDFPSIQSLEYHQYILSRQQLQQDQTVIDKVYDQSIDQVNMKPCFNYQPWCNLLPSTLDLILHILNPSPIERADMTKICQHNWMRQDNPLLNDKMMCADPEKLLALILPQPIVNGGIALRPADIGMYYSQPDFLRSSDTQHGLRSIFVSFSQPLSRLAVLSGDENYDTFTQEQGDNEGNMTTTQKQKLFTGFLPSLRLTRFFTLFSPKKLQSTLCDVFTNCCVNHTAPQLPSLPSTLAYTPTSNQPVSLFIAHFSTVDRRKCPLRGDVMATHAGMMADPEVRQGDNKRNYKGTIAAQLVPLWVVVFHKRKGDPLEFKRLYQAVVENMAEAVYVRADLQ